MNKSEAMKSQQFQVVELGTTYKLPKFRVVDGKGIQLVRNVYNEYQDGRTPLDKDVEQEITFVRGDKRTVTKEEFENAVKVIDSCWSFLGYPKFEVEYMKWDGVRNGLPIYNLEKADTIAVYNKAKDVINSYINPIPRVDGILHEQLLGMMITDLEYKISLVPSSESTEALKNLKQALFWLNERTNNRVKREVEGTYQK